MASPLSQSRYQVRLERGVEGLARLAPADVVVVVDVIGLSSVATDAVARGGTLALDSDSDSDSDSDLRTGPGSGGALVLDSVSAPLVLLGCLRNASAVADAVAAEQRRRGERTAVAIIAAGDRDGDAATRPAVEDDLGAGAIIDALAARGIDHTSPEAAVVCEAFRGLRGAVRHLLTASGSGQSLIDGGRRDEVLAAAELDAVPVVPVLRDGRLVAL